jgi:hypothetical protein
MSGQNYIKIIKRQIFDDKGVLVIPNTRDNELANIYIH